MNLGMETETVEYKRSTSEMREGMESIASILDKHGQGTLYFGVRNDGEVVGQEVSEKTLRDVSQAVANHIEPRVYPQIERLVTDDGKAYVRVEFSGFETPYACDGRYRIRSADEDDPMSRARLQGMIMEAGNRSKTLGMAAAPAFLYRMWTRRPFVTMSNAGSLANESHFGIPMHTTCYRV